MFFSWYEYMKKYEIRIKKAGWEKEEIPDQLFIPPKFKVRLKPEQLDFNPDRFKPVRTRRGVPKPSGGLWTSDYDYENNTSEWNEWLIENMPQWVPKGDSGLILRPDPDRVKAYHINDFDDYKRLQRDFPAYHHYRLDEDQNRIPGAELETINWERLFDPKEQGGAGLDGLRVTETGLDDAGDKLSTWDIPSSVWSPGAPLSEVGKMDPSRNLWERYDAYHPKRYSSLNSLLSKIAHLDNIGAYNYSDNITDRIILAQNDLDEIQEIDQEVQVDPTKQDFPEKDELLSKISILVKDEKFHMLSVGEDSKTPKGLASGFITGILYLEPGTSTIYNMREFEQYVKSQEKGKRTRFELWNEFKQNNNPEKEVVTCTHASPSCLKDCIYHTGNARFDSVHAAREMRTSKLFHPETKQNTMEDIEEDIMDLQYLCSKLNSRYGKKLKEYFGQGFQFQPVIRLNGTTDINWAKEAAYLHEKFPNIQFYDYTKVPKYMDMYLNGQNPYTGKPFAPNYHVTFSRSESNRTDALRYLEMGGNVAIVFDKIPETLSYNGKTYRVVDGDRHDLRFLDDVEGKKQQGEGLVIGLKYKRPMKTEEKRKTKVTRFKEKSPLFRKLEMMGEGQEVHEAPFVINTNGEKNVVVG
jgi:hypothetical protein